MFLREHGVSIRVWQDLVPGTKRSAVIDFGDITGMAKAAGLRLPDGTDRLVVHYQCTPDDIRPNSDGGTVPVGPGGNRGLSGTVSASGQR